MENNNKNGYKIYGILLEINDTLFLTMQYASSLEEAFSQAKLEFRRLSSPKPEADNSLLNAKIGLFIIKDINQMLHEHKVFDERKIEKIALKHHKAEQKEIKLQSKKKVEIKKVEITQEEIKNMIMREIVTKKDKNIFEEHKNLFNDNEKQYLMDKIENKKK